MPTRSQQVAAAWLGVIFGCLLTIAAIVRTCLLYPDDYDPKNMTYILWFHGFDRNVNLDHMIGALDHDPDRNRYVSGLSEDQLRRKVGFIHELKDARPYLQWCIAQVPLPAGVSVLLLRDSDLAVFLRNGRAYDTRTIKGC